MKTESWKSALVLGDCTQVTMQVLLLSKNDIDVPDMVFLHLNEMHDRRAHVHVTKFKAGVNSNCRPTHGNMQELI